MKKTALVLGGVVAAAALTVAPAQAATKALPPGEVLNACVMGYNSTHSTTYTVGQALQLVKPMITPATKKLSAVQASTWLLAQSGASDLPGVYTFCAGYGIG